MTQLPYQYHQRGGAFKVNGFVALALLAAAVGSALYGYYQHSHRVIEIHLTSATIKPNVWPAAEGDEFVTHAFPQDDGGSVCTFVNTICHIKI